MNKSDLIANIAMDANLTKSQAAAALQAVEDAIGAALAEGGSVSWIGFGTFSVKERAARTGRNPKTGEELQIAAAKVPSFKAGKALKEAVK
ncbi:MULTISPECIES: HU family DNA-binding protein [Acinetobacter calcoaceticus/baumannii complex]|uniref:HU family DNA-binding protein n=1 Tax=Acinetobacter calcoaceticus/baumannii complex TaxID=909768 RepID=UPI00049FE749|nr:MULTISPECIES: HU family DNA-binding protein [Acinetobacter calcoaceticus/baumannii complex]KCX99131.1 DNA-binding protein HU-beta [Acinetobacter sp. 72431]KQD49270.1 DNA-binding protein HU [Acinetobacter pittii]MBQ5174271.1 HU family DNA-binding protein [Acinetobacter pittii]MCF1280294.1 HU family DNA-binding protein [Acinetobacter pittii]MCU4544471.1 HU family DNA-binding protein [Acinetobacter pittii]